MHKGSCISRCQTQPSYLPIFFIFLFVCFILCMRVHTEVLRDYFWQYLGDHESVIKPRPHACKHVLSPLSSLTYPFSCLLCSGAVEACLLHQLRRRTAGFLRSDKMAALFTKVGKTCPVTGEICHKVQELQHQVEGR